MPHGQLGRLSASLGAVMNSIRFGRWGQKLTLYNAVVGVMRALKCHSEHLFNYAIAVVIVQACSCRLLSLQPPVPRSSSISKRSPAAAEERGRKDSERLTELGLAVAPELNSGKLLDI